MKIPRVLSVTVVYPSVSEPVKLSVDNKISNISEVKFDDRDMVKIYAADGKLALFSWECVVDVSYGVCCYKCFKDVLFKRIDVKFESVAVLKKQYPGNTVAKLEDCFRIVQDKDTEEISVIGQDDLVVGRFPLSDYYVLPGWVVKCNHCCGAYIPISTEDQLIWKEPA